METEQSLPNINAGDERHWDRAWTVDEIRKNSANWSLAGDVGLYNLLNEFSHNIISRTHEVENAVDSLVHQTKMASAKISNIINDFHMLSNLQFVENRVYDEEIEEPSPEENVTVEKTKEQKEAEMLPKIIKAIELGLSVLDQAFDKINVNEISDSEDEEELSSEGRTILEPKDPYENRPLPFIIGSEEFQNNDYAGLQDLIEEDVEMSDQVESSSMSETDETSDEEEPLPLDDDKFSLMQNKVRRTESVSDKISSSEESELFGSEKDENGFMSDSSFENKTEEGKNIQISDVESKSNEKVSRPSSISSMQSKLNLPQVLPVSKLQEKKKGSDDLFANEDEISDDESPFRKKTSLFASDTRFDENKDIFGDDLFDEKPKEVIKNIKSPKEIQTTNEVPSVMKKNRDNILFGNDDDSEDDIFNTLMKTKKPDISKKPNAGSQDSSEKGDSSSTPSSAVSVKPSSSSFGYAAAGASDLLFGDESHDDDLFSNKNDKKFKSDTFEDDDLFGTYSTKSSKKLEVPDKDKSTKDAAKQSSLFENVNESNQVSEKPLLAALSIRAKDSLFNDSDSSDQETKESIIPISLPKKKEEIDLFADDVDDIFSQKKPKGAILSKSTTQEPKDSLFSKPLEEDVVQPPDTSKKIKKSLFDDSDNFDLFSSQKDKLVEPFQDPQYEQKKSIFEDSNQADDFISSKTEKTSPPKILADKEDMFTGFDIPADSSRTLNVLNKDRAKITTKRRKPTKRGRLAALESSDKENINTNSALINSEDIKSSKDEELFFDSKDKTSSSETTSPTNYKAQEKKKMDLMSQLMSEVTSTKIGKKHTPDYGKLDHTVESSNGDQTENDNFSFLSPVKDSFDSGFPSKTKDDDSNIISLESEDNDDFFAEPSFKNFRSSISHKDSVLDLEEEEEEDDLFSSVKSTVLPKVKKDDDPDDIFADDSDIFADVQKEKYEMFPTLLYDDEDDDIFGSVDQQASGKTNVVPKTTAPTSTKKEVEKKQVNVFEDPLTGLLGDD